MSELPQQQQAPGATDTTNPSAQAPYPPPAGAPPASYYPSGHYPPPGPPPTGYYPPPPGHYPCPPPAGAPSTGQYPPPSPSVPPGSHQSPAVGAQQPHPAATSAPGQQSATPAAVPAGQQAPAPGAPQGYPAYPGYAPWPGYPPPGGYPGYPPPPGPPGQQQPYQGFPGYAPPYGAPPQGYGQPPAPYGAYPTQPQAPGAPQPSGSPQPPLPGQLPAVPSYPAYGQPPATMPGYPAPAPSMPDSGASGTLSGKEIWYLGTKILDPEAPAAAVGMQKVPGFEPEVKYAHLVRQKKSYASEITFVKFVLEMPLLSRDALNDYCVAQRGQDLYGVLQDPSPTSCISSTHVMTIVKALIQGPLKFDIELLKGALSGVGANEMVLTEILLNRSFDDIVLLNKAYTQNYGRTLIQHIATQSDLSLSQELKRLFTMALNNQRDRSLVVDHGAVESDVQALISGRKGKEDHERSKFIEIFVNRSQPHLAAVITSFGQRSKSLSSVIKGSKYFPKDFKSALLFILHGVKPKRDGQGIWRDAKLLEKTMAGMGTRDTALVYRLIRAHWDPTRFAAIKTAYFNHYNKGLETRVSGETSGTYREALILLIKSNETNSSNETSSSRIKLEARVDSLFTPKGI